MSARKRLRISRHIIDATRGAHIEFVFKSDGVQSRKTFPLEELNTSRAQIFAWLGRVGVPLSPELKAAVDVALRNVPSGQVGHIAKSPGWYDNSYVLGRRVYPKSYQNIAVVADENLTSSNSRSGDLKGWRRAARAPLLGTPATTFVFMLAFAGPILRILGEGPICCSIVGRSSRGKSTVQRMATTVWDASSNGSTFNKSPLAFQDDALRHRDGFLALDEMSLIGTSDTERSQRLAELIYRLATARPRESHGVRLVSQSIRGIYLFSSNIAFADLMKRAGTTYQNQDAVRLIEIAIDNHFPIFADFEDHAKRSRAIRSLHDQLAGNGGNAIHAFLTNLTQRANQNAERLRKRLNRYASEGLEALGPIPDEVLSRVASQVVTIYAAGRLAAHYGVLPYSTRRMRKAIQAVWERLSAQLMETLARDPVEDLLAMLVCQKDDWVDVSSGPLPMSKDALDSCLCFSKTGKDGSQLLYITAASLSRITPRSKFILAELETRGLLRRDSGRRGKRQVKMTVATDKHGKKIRPRLYCIALPQTDVRDRIELRASNNF